MANAVELLLKLKGDTKGLKGVQNGIKNVGTGLKSMSKEAEKASSSLSKITKTGVQGFKDLASGTAVAGGAVAIFVQQVNSMNVALRQAATLSGTSIETFQAFATVGERAGISMEQTADAMNDLNLKITEWAELGSGAAGDVFKVLGLDPVEMSKIQDSGEQMLIFLEKLNKSSSNVQRLFADELASDAFIYFQRAAGEVGNLRAEIEKIGGGTQIISQEESDALIKFNGQMVDLQNLIKKVGAQAVLSFENELAGALESAGAAANKLIKDLQDPFSDTNRLISGLDGTLDILIGGLKVAKDSADLLWSSTGGQDFDNADFKRNLKEFDNSFQQYLDGFRKTVYFDAHTLENQFFAMIDQFEGVDPAAMIAQGFNEEQIREVYRTMAQDAVDGIDQYQEIINRYPQVIRNTLNTELSYVIRAIKVNNERINEELSNIDLTIKPDEKETEEALASTIIRASERAVKNAQATIDLLQVQFKAGTIDLDEFKTDTQKQVDIQIKALEEASEKSVGIDQLTYKKRLEQAKIFSKQVGETTEIQTKEQQNQIKANNEIAQQEIQILRNKGEYLAALEKQKQLEQEQIQQRVDLSDIDKAIQIINIEEMYGFEEAQIKADALVQTLEKNIKSLSTAEGAEKVSILGNIENDISNLKILKAEYAGLNADVVSIENERNEILQEQKITEDEIKSAANQVLQSKIQVLKQQGEITEATKLELQYVIQQLNENKALTGEQRQQLANDAIFLSNAKQRAAELQKIKSANSEIQRSQLELLRAQGLITEANKLQLDIDIQRINANKNLTSEQKQFLASNAIKIANIEKEEAAQNKIKANQDLIASKELELLNIQGQKSAALQKQFEITSQQIINNDQLTNSTKEQVLAIERQKLAYSQAALEVAKIEQNVSKVLEQMKTAETVEEYNKLAASISPAVAELQKLEAQFPGLQTKSQEFVDESVAGMDRYKVSVEQAANFYADNFVNTFDQVISGTKTVGEAFKDMIYQMVQELLKSNLSQLMQGLFNGGGGGTDIFTGIAGLFSGTAFHNGGVAGSAGGFARNFQFNIADMLPKYHTGGIAGLKPNEVATVLERGEEVLTASDPRHVNNGGKSSNQINIINEMNTENSMKDLGSTRSFSNAVRNELLSNPNEYKSILS